MPDTILVENKSTKEIQRIFKLQLSNHLNVGKSSARERINKLKRFGDAIMRYQPEIQKAVYQDFKKPVFEVDATEILPLMSGLRHVKRNLRKWMAPHRVAGTLPLLGSTSWIQYESKGVCLIISPWNFPFNLSFVPLVSAIAAGNCAIIKPSEHTPHSSALIKKIVQEVFDENEVAVIEGAIEESQALLKLPFHHIFFTGSPQVGKIVMKAAAENLTSVTLELGGKSPTIVDETVDIKSAAASISFAKYTNCGQICIAPDYILVHKSVEEKLINAMKKSIAEFYGKEVSNSESYPRIVNRNHFRKLKSNLEDALSKGARILFGGNHHAESKYFEPTFLTDVNMDMQVMTEEIFGPLLPFRSYEKLQEVIDFINSGERPLALNIYSRNRKNIDFILQNTRVGGTCINNSSMHFMNHNLPFGGINNSGIGKSHGWYGFRDFSHERSVYRQDFPGIASLLTPPYKRWKEKVIDLTLKWF